MEVQVLRRSSPRGSVFSEHLAPICASGLQGWSAAASLAQAHQLRAAFKHMDSTFPLYGKRAQPPIQPEEWWTQLIRLNMIHAGASEAGESSSRLLLRDSID